MIEYILFDLDGTLNESGKGIKNSIRYALKKFDIIDETEQKINNLIGPPLVDGFREFYGLSEEDSKKAVTYYREYYGTKGKFECELYLGVSEMLKTLVEKGKKLVVCTSKPQGFTTEILKHVGVFQYFTFVQGATLDGSLSEKPEIIAKALTELGIKESDAIMVGDRKFDVLGAKENGVKSVGVLYGYGDRQELENSGADYIVESVKQLEKLLISL